LRIGEAIGLVISATSTMRMVIPWVWLPATGPCQDR
jgi:hypothetical protein